MIHPIGIPSTGSTFCIRLVLGLAVLLGFAGAGMAQITLEDEPSADPVYLSLDDAIDVALERNYVLRGTRLNIEDAEAQIQSAVGSALPSLSLSSSYQRNLVSANPFAGSSAGGLFGSLGAIDWLAYNEEARSDDDPSTLPISLDEFRRRQADGLEEAGITVNQNDNPFAVDNQFTAGLTLSQTLYDQRVLLAIKGARQLRASNEAGYARQMQTVINSVKQAYYQALFAQDQSTVVEKSVRRTAATLDDTQKRVVQGVSSKYERLSAEVELSNLETELIQADNQADLALNNLKMTLGLPIDRPIILEGSLESRYADRAMLRQISLNDAVATALNQRPDLQQAGYAIELQQLQRQAERADFFPTVSAFANFNFTGRVPDSRTFSVTDPNDPFSYTQQSEGFFADQYWNPDVAVGIRLSWNIFDGFQRRARIQRQAISVRQRQLELEQLYQTVRSEVEQALLNLQAAERRIVAQQQNVQRATLNYEFASTRLSEGVSNRLEERQASDLLDQSQLGYLQALQDYLLALSSYETAIGTVSARPSDTQMTSR